MTSWKPWWETEIFENQAPIPAAFIDTGPKGLALVSAYEDGRTQSGWGLEGKDGAPGFMENYMKGRFDKRPKIINYRKNGSPFAIVMRSLPVICIDIDGKNGGLEHVQRLGPLPLTLGETSKSGNGYHLYYRTDDQWDQAKGFAKFQDLIGIEQGVDIRATGCVYHYPQQRWNNRGIEALPEFLADRLLQKKVLREKRAEAAKVLLQTGEDWEILMEQQQLLARLAAPIPEGKRNNTLFAIGQDLKNAGVDEWPQYITDRAGQLGLPNEEIERLVRNIENYN